MRIYSKPTGYVWISDYDLGIVKNIGGFLLTPEQISEQIASNGNTYGNDHGCKFKNKFFLESNGLVPIIFNNPDQLLESKTLPFIHVARESVDPARERWHSSGAKEYYHGIPGSELIVNGVSGFSKIEYKDQAWPFDLTYRISVYAKYEREALSLLRYAMRNFQVIGRVSVIDTFNEVRGYTSYIEGSISDLSEIVDVSDRTKAYAFTVRIEGELDLKDAQVVDTVSGFRINLDLINDASITN